MKPHIIKVAMDKHFILNYYLDIKNLNLDRNIRLLFEGMKVKYLTTFTDFNQHFGLLNTPTSKLSIEDKYLQNVFRTVNFGSEIFDKILNDQITKENIESLPDIVFTKSEELQNACKKIGVLVFNDTEYLKNELVDLKIKNIDKYFIENIEHPYWKIRIEDRYLLKNIKTENDAIKFFNILNLKDQPYFIEIIYSDEKYDYIFKSKDGELQIINKDEREFRKDLIRKAGKNHFIKFNTKAGHDRFICTNSSLFIIGNSITSNKETHITYYPFLQFYNEYFKE